MMEEIKALDERIIELERLLSYLQEKRREIINRNDLNKVRDAEKA